MIKDYSLSLLEQAMNKTLQLDADWSAKLAPLSNKLIALFITSFEMQLFIEFTPSGIHLSSTSSRDADTLIRSSLLGLIRLARLPAAEVRHALNDQIQITGDLELGLQVKQLLSRLDLDWEGQLATLTGDVVAHQIGRWVRGGASRAQQIQTSIAAQCAEYLHEELRVLPPSEEVRDFFADIDELSLQVERLAAHINHYRAQHAAS